MHRDIAVSHYHTVSWSAEALWTQALWVTLAVALSVALALTGHFQYFAMFMRSIHTLQPRCTLES